jgi:anti-anti-sigma factor
MSLAPPLSSVDDSPLCVSVDVRSGRITLTGDLDHCSAHLLVDALPLLAAGPSTTWSVDASAVTFCDGGGLAALVQTRDSALAAGRRLHVVAASRCVRRIIDMTGTGHLLPVTRHLSPVAG